MSPTIATDRRRLQGPCGFRAFIGVFAALVLSSFLAAATASASEPPLIEKMFAGIGGEVEIGAKIDPGGLETSYRINLGCDSCQPRNPQATGELPPVEELIPISFSLADLQAGRYEFAVYADNADGEVSKEFEFEVPPFTGSFPDGTSEAKVIEAPHLGSSTEQLMAIALREQEQRHAKELEELKRTEELTARPRSEFMPPPEPTPPQPKAVCLVPKLRGDTLAVARHALAKAHCELGPVDAHKRRRGTPRVTSQSPKPGRRLAAGARVKVALGHLDHKTL